MTTTEIVTRSEAVDTIAAAIADRTAFVVLAGPHMLADVARALDAVPTFAAYLDAGHGGVMRACDAVELTLVSLLAAPTAAVLLVPKTVPAGTLAAAFGRDHIPADGSRDLVVLCDDGPVAWPLIFVDALAIVDPRAAMQIRASDLASTS